LGYCLLTTFLSGYDENPPEYKEKMTSERSVYRSRIYGAYSSARDRPLAPDMIEGLKPRLPYLRRLIQKLMPTDRTCSVFDLGCGHGALIYALREAGYRNVRGVDGSSEQVAAAKRLGIAEVEAGDILDTLAQMGDASVDVIVTFDVIEHFTKDELIPLVDHIFRILKSGGRWIIHSPNCAGPFGVRVFFGDFTHELAFTPESIDQLLRASGFARVECYEDRPVPHGLKSTIRLSLWIPIRILLLSYLAVETGFFDRKAVLSQNLLAVGYKG